MIRYSDVYMIIKSYINKSVYVIIGRLYCFKVWKIFCLSIACYNFQCALMEDVVLLLVEMGV